MKGQGETERDRSSTLWFTSQMVMNGQGLDRSNLGTRSFFWVSHMDLGAQALEQSSVALLGALAGIWMRSGAGRT